MLPRWKLRLFRAGMLGLLLVGALVGLELALRAYQAWWPVWFLPHSDRLLTFHGRPFERNFAERLNSHGYNDEEFRTAEPSRFFRLAGIADSFGFGVVPRRYNIFTLLEQRLAATGAEIEVCNLSVVSTGPAEYARQLRAAALPLQPDLVICLFYIGNDFTDALPPAPPTLAYPQRLLRLAGGVWRNDRAAIDEFREASYVLALADYLRVAGRLREADEAYSDTEPYFTPADYRAIRRAESVIFRADSELLPRLAEEQANRLAAMQADAAAAGAGFLVVLAPQELQVLPDLQREVLGDTTGYDYARPNRVFAELLRQRGIACLDLLPAFMAAAPRHALYKPRDTHWNIAGNALAAEQVAARVNADFAAALRRPAPAGPE